MHVFLAILAVSLFAVPHVAVAEQGRLEHSLPVQVTRVIDGDTIVIAAQTWLDTTTTAVVRLEGIDTPELRTSCDEEKALAQRAKQALEELISAQNGRVVLHDIRHGTYASRVIARVTTQNGSSIGDTLIRQGLARAYDGRQRRDPWC